MLAASNTRVLGSGKTSASAFKAVKPARLVQARASGRDQPDVFASSAFAAAAAALLLVSSPVSAAEVSANPLAMTADGNIFERLWNKVPKTKPISDDTYASGRKEGRTLASTTKPMEIITEQEAVAPEAFPNPATRVGSEKPAVLAAAEGDEQYGANRGQFEGLTAADRQRLIDEKSPAQFTRK